MKNDFIDAGIGERGNPADVLRDKGADAADVDYHRAAFNLVGPDGGFVDGGSGGAQPRDAESDASEENSGNRGIDNTAYFFSASVRWSLYVHNVCHLGGRSEFIVRTA